VSGRIRPDKGGKRGGRLSQAEAAQVIEDAEEFIKNLTKKLEALAKESADAE
jgi:hypothetical protein